MVIVDSIGKVDRQVQAANNVLGRMRETLQFFNIQLFKMIYLTFIS